MAIAKKWTKPKRNQLKKKWVLEPIFKNTGYRTTATGIQWSIFNRRSPTNDPRGGQTSDKVGMTAFGVK